MQDEFDKFLQERGINESLAFFVPEYAEHKEQKVCSVLVPHLSTCLLITPLFAGVCEVAAECQDVH